MVLIELVQDAVQILTLLIIVRAILSWIPSLDYGHPLVRSIVRITDPILLPFRRAIPPMGGIDISVIVALLVIQLAGRFLIQLLYSLLAGA